MVTHASATVVETPAAPENIAVAGTLATVGSVAVAGSEVASTPTRAVLGVQLGQASNLKPGQRSAVYVEERASMGWAAFNGI